MTPDEFLREVEQLPFGKRLPNAIYILDCGEEYLPRSLRLTCAELRRRLTVGPEFNILKFHTDQPKISFLSYPGFQREPHPALQSAVVVNLVTGRIRHDNYANRANPPILHRKECFLPADHPDRGRFAALTKDEEEAGLLTSSRQIGFKLNWERLLEEKKLIIAEGRLTAAHEIKAVIASMPIERHRTAIVRRDVSRPVKLLLEHCQLRRGESFFDYGCGLGSDVESLSRLGYAANGWDPVYAADMPKQSADVVNLGFVLNVIEDPVERVDVLVQAWNLSRRLLVVSTLVQGQEAYNELESFSDGVVTTRRTFQKHFEPAELQSLIEDSIEAEAVPIALGVYFVFRERDELQDFLSERTRRFIDWEGLSRRLGIFKALRERRDPYLDNRELLDGFWEAMLDFGRVPTELEFQRLSEVRASCGSIPQAVRLFNDRFGAATLEAARARRREDVLVYVASAFLRKKVPFNHLSERLQRDIRSFFGNHAEAQRKAMEILFAAGDIDELSLAVQELGYGFWDSDNQQFTVHRSLLDELPLILRVFVECAARLFGDPRESDLIKFHLRSRKLTFQSYLDFDTAATPELRLRIKIDLPRLFVNVIDHSAGPDRQLLYFKERFLKNNHPEMEKMCRFSARLRSIGFDERTMGYGPSKAEFEALLSSRGLNKALIPKRMKRRT